MIQIKLSSGSRYISRFEEQAIESVKRLLSEEDGYIIPVMFIGEQISNREIDALLLLPDAIFLLDFKNWAGQRIEVDGIDGKVKRLRNGAWEEKDNPLPNYEYAARIVANLLKRERGWLPVCPRVYSLMVFTSFEIGSRPLVSFAGGDPNRPVPKGGVGACHIEQLPQLIAAFRAVESSRVQLNKIALASVAQLLLTKVKPPAKPHPLRVGEYLIIAEHHIDTFLNCKISLGEGDPIKEPVWIKEYDQVFASPEQRSRKEQLVLRHAHILYRFPQHENIVPYRSFKSASSHLYVMLTRKPGAFLSELLTGKPLGPTKEADLRRIPFDLDARLRILGDLLKALDYLTQQEGFEQSAYRDLRPDSIFVEFTGTNPVAQLFNFDCTKIPGDVTRLGHLKAGLKRPTTWEDYASPELLNYIHAEQTAGGVPLSFTGDVSTDIFSWAIIAWELLTGELPFPDTEAKLKGRRSNWPAALDPHMPTAGSTLEPEAIRLIQACLEQAPANRPSLATLRSHFS